MSSEMYSLRILSKGQITDLSKGFGLNGIPFSIYVRKKTVSLETDLLVGCQLICDDRFSEIPVPVGDWTPAAIVKIAPGAIALSEYDVYWGAGEKIK
jgi:hypothetical protein